MGKSGALHGTFSYAGESRIISLPINQTENTMNLEFVPRRKLTDREWDNEAELWERPEIDRKTLKQLNQLSTPDGMVRLIVHVLCIAATGWLTVFAFRYHPLLAVVPYLVFTFFVGFLNGIEHEMRHKIVFSRRLDGFSDAVFFLIHVLFKDGTRYQRASHRIHHRYTMVFGVDPESDFPEVLTLGMFGKCCWAYYLPYYPWASSHFSKVCGPCFSAPVVRYIRWFSRAAAPRRRRIFSASPS